MYSVSPPPPVPPPKPSSHDASRLGTPSTIGNNVTSIRDATATPERSAAPGAKDKGKGIAVDASSGLIPASVWPSTGSAQQERRQEHEQLQAQERGQDQPQPPLQLQEARPLEQDLTDPGDQWSPSFLQDRSKQDLADILSNPAALNALSHGLATIHPSLAASYQTLQSALSENIALAQHLNEMEARLSHERSTAQARLLSTHSLERQWRAKQGEMDDALAPFAPASLYSRLTAGLQEQEMVCQALEESFLEGSPDGEQASERETLDWVRRYREAKKLLYLRQERKERWNERRVGGWR